VTKITTAGELRGFLAEVLLGIRSGAVDVEEAHAIAKVSAQINHSLAVEVNTALQLQKMGKDHPEAGSMLIANGSSMALEEAPEPIWCEQCDKRVTDKQITACKDQFCKVKKL
jgi:Zn finger protein HypA/HybF involved in hydrogenase expression